MKLPPLGPTLLRVKEVCSGSIGWIQCNAIDGAHARLDYTVRPGIRFIGTAEHW